MKDERNPRELHTEADDLQPLSPEEAEAMGRQTEGSGGVFDPKRETVYADIESSPENEDQADAHHADPDEHV
jgi:hypothetical protein